MSTAFFPTFLENMLDADDLVSTFEGLFSVVKLNEALDNPFECPYFRFVFVPGVPLPLEAGVAGVFGDSSLLSCKVLVVVIGTSANSFTSF